MENANIRVCANCKHFTIRYSGSSKRFECYHYIIGGTKFNPSKTSMHCRLWEPKNGVSVPKLGKIERLILKLFRKKFGLFYDANGKPFVANTKRYIGTR